VRKAFRVLVLSLLVLISGGATGFAGDYYRFTQDRLQEFQQAGYPILVEIDASWCPICAKQRPIVERLRHTAELGEMRILVIDFDTQKKDVRAMGAEIQSTLIAFHGNKEMGRLVGETDEDAIHKLLSMTKG